MMKKNWPLLIVVIIIAIFIFFIDDGEDIHKEPLVTPLSTDPSPALENEAGSAAVFVDVKGEVVIPGIYELEQTARVNDVINLAGGFTSEANQTHVNLAQIVQDEMVIIVPRQGDEETILDKGVSESSKVRVNYATQEEVETLSGIGPSKAKAIIQYREENGMFKVVEDLLNVSGIGEKTLENIRDDIQIP